MFSHIRRDDIYQCGKHGYHDKFVNIDRIPVCGLKMAEIGNEKNLLLHPEWLHDSVLEHWFHANENFRRFELIDNFFSLFFSLLQPGY